MFPGLTELRLMGCLIELIWTQKSKLNTSTPKNQLADILTKGNFTRDEWNHLLCLFNISHFSSTMCSDIMAKRSQQDSGEERVTAKEDRSGRPDKGTDLFEASDHHCHEQFMESFSSACYSKLDDDRAWSSQDWKTDHDVRPIGAT